MIKRLSILFIILFLIAGCSNAVRSSISERYVASAPRTVAVVPVAWESGDIHKDIAYTFRAMTVDKLETMGYRAIPLSEVDDTYLKLGSSALAGKPPAELAKLLGSDAVLYIKIKEWNVDRFVTYASLKIQAVYELYSSSGEKLWQADYTTKDSDLRLDQTSMEYAVIKAYEPKVQRFVDAVFSTLPQAQVPSGERTFFQWLP